MERIWTDPRDRTEWSVKQAGAIGVHGDREPDEPSEESPQALVFESGDERHSIPTHRAAGLREMNDAQLQGLLDAAREDAAEPDADLRDSGNPSGRRGPGVEDPEASGRQPSPHADPAEHGRTGSD